MSSPTSPIPIPLEAQPSPFMLPETDSFSSTSSVSHTITLSRLPERPSVLTNKLSPINAIPIDPNQPESPLILSSTTLPSVRSTSISRHTPISRSHCASSSSLSTPALSNSSSKTVSRNGTPIRSPSTTQLAGGSAYYGTRAGALSPRDVISPMEVMTETKRLQELLSEDDKYLIFLRDEIGETSWKLIAEAMVEKGFAAKEKGLRLRYCELKRDLDVKLKAEIADVHTTQAEVDKVLGFGPDAHGRRRRLASFGTKPMNPLRVFEEQEEAMLRDLVFSLRASGIK